MLTPEERALLAGNTEALLARFSAEDARLRAEAELKLRNLREQVNRAPTTAAALSPLVRSLSHQVPGMAQRRLFPWGWMKANSSVAAFKLNDGSSWVRVQHIDGRQFIVPWPSFDGWEEALPPVVGRPNLEIGGYEAGLISDAVAYLRTKAEWQKVTGLWGDIAAVLGTKS